MKRFLLLLSFALTPAAIASPNPSSQSKAADQSGIPAPFLQLLTLDQTVTVDQDSTPASLVQASPESEQRASDSGDGKSTEEAAAALAKAAQNPIANLISLPFQNNTIFGYGPLGKRTQNVLNIQPVIPVPLSKDLLLVTRTIVPFIYQPTSASGNTGEFGLGDINPQFYFSPRTNSNITWGLGPTFVLPTATQSLTGQGKWSAGPAAVVVVTTKHMVFGAVGNNVWSFAGASDRQSVNQFLVQPFLN
ncbi:neuromedin U [Synechococcus sp. EJ6-Ellesmere]|uniref:neuromedin U n=1 Tax=Synechococcus sp. EJ6-Ellesmere TaxID=2823734 RepID=UPI0020CDD6D7|nr:neuromedin U [Synechococcus sp. EJ6-Ellesmere]MCP9826756.1 neuromedin U [Synechococcus sp. EJ6-Ellesmere]